jgi:hypothetical protein
VGLHFFRLFGPKGIAGRGGERFVGGRGASKSKSKCRLIFAQSTFSSFLSLLLLHFSSSSHLLPSSCSVFTPANLIVFSLFLPIFLPLQISLRSPVQPVLTLTCHIPPFNEWATIEKLVLFMFCFSIFDEVISRQNPLILGHNMRICGVQSPSRKFLANLTWTSYWPNYEKYFTNFINIFNIRMIGMDNNTQIL